MAWSSPRTWTAGELVTAAFLNQEIRDNLLSLYQQKKYVVIEVVAPGTSWTTGNGKKYFHIPSLMNGMNLVEVHMFAVTAGVTGTSTVNVYNLTDSVNMLSTALSIDSTETGSNTAATPAVIDTTKDDVATNDVIRIDIDTTSTTAPKGLVVTLGFSF